MKILLRAKGDTHTGNAGGEFGGHIHPIGPDRNAKAQMRVNAGGQRGKGDEKRNTGQEGHLGMILPR